MLYTNLNHIETASQLEKIISENENVMVCCGRMGPMCIPVYGIMEELEPVYSNVKFFDMQIFRVNTVQDPGSVGSKFNQTRLSFKIPKHF